MRLLEDFRLADDDMLGPGSQYRPSPAS
ncbi:hypothetical protein MY10362_003936 [Beauveria mimosiformis]